MKRIALLSSMLLAFGLSAHPGHGPVDSGLAHWMFSMEHLVLIAGLALILVFALRKERKTN